MIKASTVFQVCLVVISFLGILAFNACFSESEDLSSQPVKRQGQTLSTPYEDLNFYEYVTASIGGKALPYINNEDIFDDAVGLKVPYIEGTLLDGSKEIIFDDSNSGLDSQSTVIIVLAHWCPYCRNEVRELSKYFIENEIPETIRMISLVTSVDPAGVNYPPHQWFDEESWSIPVIVDTIESDIAHYLGVNIFPSFVIIDENGIVTLRLAGRIGPEGFKSLISELDKRHLGGDIK
tara:strand:+ start:358 stop:1065 length:708 start_codon:yes stop_codon:yes gene_type:complete